MFKALHNSLLSLVYPQECRVCSGQVETLEDGVACGKCWDSTRFFGKEEMLCGRCGAFLGDTAAPSTVFCHRCDHHHYKKAFAVGVYEKAIAASIISLKSSPTIPARLRSEISKTLSIIDRSAVDLIVSIPLSKRRRLERGYNQADIIAQYVSREIGVPVDTMSLVRKLHTPIHRIGMDQKARELTVKNAFDVARPKLISGKTVLLVDDVLTSGSTASYCSKVLIKNGASSVSVFTLARAVMN